MKPKISNINCNNIRCFYHHNGKCSKIELTMQLKFYGKTVCTDFKSK